MAAGSAAGRGSSNRTRGQPAGGGGRKLGIGKRQSEVHEAAVHAICHRTLRHLVAARLVQTHRRAAKFVHGCFHAPEQCRHRPLSPRIRGEAADRHRSLDQIATAVVELMVSRALRAVQTGGERHAPIVHLRRRLRDAVDAVDSAAEQPTPGGHAKVLAKMPCACELESEPRAGVVNGGADMRLPSVPGQARRRLVNRKPARRITNPTCAQLLDRGCVRRRGYGGGRRVNGRGRGGR